MSALAAAIQFLLITPAFVRRQFTPKDLGASITFFPLVGLLLGSVLAAFDVLLAYAFPLQVRSALLLALWISLTGALHFDGFVDACDGLLGGHTPEHRMEIMRDEHTGAFGTAGGILVLLAMYAALNSMPLQRTAGLLLAPVLGRCAIALSVVTYPYARAAGLGRQIKDEAQPRHATAAVLTALAVAGCLGWQAGILLPAAAVAGAFIVWRLAAAFVMHRIGGMTGDTYGAINMLIEVTVLLAFAAQP